MTTIRSRRAATAAPVADLRDRFVAALAKDFRANGKAFIEDLRKNRQGDYLKAVTTHLPAQAGDPDALFDPYSDAELIAVLEKLKPKQRAGGKARRGAAAPARNE